MVLSRSAVLLSALSPLASCQEQAPTSTQDEALAPSPIRGQQCYAYYSAKDTVYLTLRTTRPVVTGVLSYRYFEKDRNQGTIRGTLRGDTLRADYTFQSEGTESVRQVVFLRSAGGFIEGQGEVADRGDKMVFTHPTALVFNTTKPLQPVACP